MMQKLTDLELGWLAGLLEGEGCFRVRNSAAHAATGRRPVLTVSLGMCDQDAVERAALLGGATMRVVPERTSNPKWRDRWRVVWSGQAAEELMLAVLPLMCSRRSQKIHECLNTSNLSHRKGNNAADSV